jgi:hypothetical protein
MSAVTFDHGVLCSARALGLAIKMAEWTMAKTKILEKLTTSLTLSSELNSRSFYLCWNRKANHF